MKKASRAERSATKRKRSHPQGIPSFETVLTQLRPGIERACVRRSLRLNECLGEIYFAYLAAIKGFKPSKGSFSRRFYFLATKGLHCLGPRKTDALAHTVTLDQGCDEAF